jgi:hypothetical protein
MEKGNIKTEQFGCKALRQIKKQLVATGDYV